MVRGLLRDSMIGACVLLVAVGSGLAQAAPARAEGAAAPARQEAQELRIGTVLTARASDARPALFRFQAESAGFLTVVVRGTDDSDLRFTITDDVGQPLPDGNVDSDIGGDQGAEQVAVALPRAGEYLVRVTTWSGTGEFRIAASWLAFPDIGSAPDPDGQPTSAQRLTPGQPIQDSLDVGDPWDWYVVTPEADGILTVITEAAQGDLVLEVYQAGSYAEALERSDQDMQGVTGNESVTVRVQAGQPFYFRVSTFSGNQGSVSYTIRAGVM